MPHTKVKSRAGKLSKRPYHPRKHKKSLKTSQPKKRPGPDGFSAEFY